jgi:hypothetical protein
MSAASHRRVAPPDLSGASPAAPRPRVSSERRRRERHFRRRRRDLLEDAVLGLVLAVVLISVTAGLGVLALLVFAIAAVLGAGVVVRRVRRVRARKLARPRRA